MPVIGDTIKLRAEFRTFASVLADPTGITLRFYDSLKKPLGDPIQIDDTHRIEAGVYEYSYVVPAGEGALYYEWSANLESAPVVVRSTFNRRWVG